MGNRREASKAEINMHKFIVAEELQLISQLRLIIDVMYFLGLSPFRLHLKSSEDMNHSFHFMVKKSLPHLLWTIIEALLSILSAVGDLRRSNFKRSKSPRSYFTIVYRITALVTIIHFAACLLFQGEKFAGLANFILLSQRNGLPIPTRKLASRVRLFGSTIALGYFVNSVIRFSLGMQYSYGYLGWLHNMSQRGQYILFLRNTTESSVGTLEEWTYVDIFFAVIGCIGSFYRLAYHSLIKYLFTSEYIFLN